MLRLILSFVVVVAAALFAGWLGARPGKVSIFWLNYQIDTSLFALIIALFISLLVVVIIFKAWMWIIGSGKKIKYRLETREHNKGILALTRGMVALAAGDGLSAQNFAKQAERLPKSMKPLALLLSARSAQVGGNKPLAKKYFKEMLNLPEMEFLGLRGLIMQTSKSNSEAILLLARRAFALNDRAPWVISTLFEFEAKEGNWRQAQKAAQQAIRYKIGNNSEYKRKLSIALLQQGQFNLQIGDKTKSHQLAEAHNFAPNFVPASTAFAKYLIDIHRYRKASRVIELTWKLFPHPDLINIYKEIYKKEKPNKIQTRIVALASVGLEDNPEVKLALAEANYHLGKTDRAFEILQAVVDIYLDHRALTLMAKIEESRNGPVSARKWIEKLDQASIPSWYCAICACSHLTWVPHCNGCGDFDTLRWTHNNSGDSATLSIINNNDINLTLHKEENTQY
tara:strand:+ start:544 stop:1905 length:1362 start_codon:yes stop_codon:yes gene_type:complete